MTGILKEVLGRLFEEKSGGLQINIVVMERKDVEDALYKELEPFADVEIGERQIEDMACYTALFFRRLMLIQE